MPNELPHPALQPVCFLDDPDYHVWVANQRRRNIGPPPTSPPCPSCTDCDGNLCAECRQRWDAMLQDDNGGEA